MEQHLLPLYRTLLTRRQIQGLGKTIESSLENSATVLNARREGVYLMLEITHKKKENLE